MENFTREHRRYLRKVNQLQERSRRLSSYRVFTFLGTAAWGLGISYVGGSTLLHLPTLVGIFLFLFWMFHQDRVDRTLAYFIKRLDLANRTRALAELNWEAIPTLPPYRGPTLPRYFSDLDLLSGHSLLRLVNQTVSTEGFARLVSYFASSGLSSQTIQQRQSIAKEAQKLRVLRRRFFVVDSLWTGLIESERIRDLLKIPLHTPRALAGFFLVLGVQASFVGLFIFFSFQGGFPFFLLAGLLLILSYRMVRKEIQILNAYSYGMSLDASLGKFSALSEVLERTSRTPFPALKKMLAPFMGDATPRQVLSRAGRTVGFLGVRQNYILHLALNFFFPWDYYWTLQLEKIRLEVKEKLPVWLDTLAEFEVFLSLAEFQATHPTYPFPTVEDGLPFSLSCKQLAHPLIPASKRVGNSFELNSRHRCAIITGSNMSGKSTFLRSLGVNVLLAKVGTVVCAESLALRPLDLATSLRLNDSLEEGLSSFYAEVKQLKRILDDAEKGAPVFYLIDEVFRGTNNRERLLGSRAYVKRISETHAVGLITTHDLELSQLADANPDIRNFHFKETIEGDQMSFSYRLAEGPCPTTNALRVMQLAGLPIENS